jgi:hypothetical protein
MEIIAFMFAAMAFIFAADARSKLKTLEKRLREKGVLDDSAQHSDESE